MRRLDPVWHCYPDSLFSIPWRKRRLLFRPLTGWARLVSSQESALFIEDHAVSIDKSSAFTDFGRGDPLPERSMFRPISLTLLLQSGCHLSCRYCYGRKDAAYKNAHLDWKAIDNATRFVARNAFERAKPLTLILHGDCEPLHNFDFVTEAVDRVRAVSDSYGVGLDIYSTTSGVLPKRSLAWALQHLKGVTLSWDGDKAAHDFNRPKRNGGSSYEDVMRASDLFHECRIPIRLRSTVTDASLDTLPAAVRSLANRLKTRVVFQLEPVFSFPGMADSVVKAPTVNRFVRGFLEILSLLDQTGCRVEYSGARLHQNHHRFCSFLQDNLPITVTGKAVGCFLPSRFSETTYADFLKCTTVDEETINSHCKEALTDFDDCYRCFAREHCSRHCPDICWQTKERPNRKSRCRQTRKILLGQLLIRCLHELTGDEIDEIVHADVSFGEHQYGVVIK